MKKITIFLLAVVICMPAFLGAQSVEISDAEKSKTSFTAQVSDILYYKDIKKTQFFVRAENIVHPENIAYWKVQSYCDKRMIIHVNASSTNDCNTLVHVDLSQDKNFYFLFGNRDNKTKNFSIKLKAYDKNGKWIHAEKIGFGWK